MRTRCEVRRSAVDELAHLQQAPLKLHEEAWTGLFADTGLEDFPGGGNRSGVCCHGGLSFMS